MLKKHIVKLSSLFTLILAFMVTTVAAHASVMNGDKEKSKDGEKEKKETVGKDEKTVVFATWYFNGTDPMDPSHYSSQPASPEQCQTPFQTICEISAPANGNQPDLTATVGSKTVEEHIQDALDALPAATPPENPVVTAYRPLN